MFTPSPPNEGLPARHGASQKKAIPRSPPLPRPPHPPSRIPARRPLLLFNTRSGPTSKDQTVDAAASITVVDAAEAIAGGDAKAAGATVGPAAICPHQNMLRRSHMIRGRVNLSPTNRLRLTISRSFSPASRSRNIRIESWPLPLRPRRRWKLYQIHRPSLRNRRSHRLNSCGIPGASSLLRACLIPSMHLPTPPRTHLSRL
jgi:hypothetical protein